MKIKLIKRISNFDHGINIVNDKTSPFWPPTLSLRHDVKPTNIILLQTIPANPPTKTETKLNNMKHTNTMENVTTFI